MQKPRNFHHPKGVRCWKELAGGFNRRQQRLDCDIVDYRAYFEHKSRFRPLPIGDDDYSMTKSQPVASPTFPLPKSGCQEEQHSTL